VKSRSRTISIHSIQHHRSQDFESIGEESLQLRDDRFKKISYESMRVYPWPRCAPAH
jgi:hypothetical protein